MWISNEKGCLFMASFAKFLRWAMFLYEGFLAIPILGGWFIIHNHYSPLWIALLLHVFASIIGFKSKQSIVGHASGVVTSILGFIPIVGWILHCVTTVILLVEGIISVLKKGN
jgi:uncharacterized membrane protein